MIICDKCEVKIDPSQIAKRSSHDKFYDFCSKCGQEFDSGKQEVIVKNDQFAAMKINEFINDFFRKEESKKLIQQKPGGKK